MHSVLPIKDANPLQALMTRFEAFLKTIRKYLPPSTATAKGHMTQEKQGIMSTKPSNTTIK